MGIKEESEGRGDIMEGEKILGQEDHIQKKDDREWIGGAEEEERGRSVGGSAYPQYFLLDPIEACLG